MEKHSIQTPQNVTIDFEIASLGTRIGSTIIDVVILYVITIILAGIFSGLGDQDKITAWDIITILPFMLYYLLTNIFMNGQTIGKQMLKIRVVKMSGHHLSIGDHIIRWLFWNFEVIGMSLISLFSCLFTKKTQRLGDLGANSIVINIKPKTSLSETLFEDIKDSYKPIYPQVVHLKDADAELIKEVIRLNSNKKSDIAIEALSKITYKIEKTLKIKRKEDKKLNFLKTILLDYNYYTQKMD